MAAEKKGNFQRRIFSPFFRRFHYAYNILDDRHDYVRKKREKEKKRDATLISTYRCVLLCAFYFEVFLKESSLCGERRYNRATLRKCLLLVTYSRNLMRITSRTQNLRLFMS